MLLLVIFALFITGCVGRRDGVSWADLTLVGDEQNILVAYNDYLVLIDPANGRPVPLRDSEGEVRTDGDGNPRRWEVLGGDTDSQFFASPIWMDNETLLVADYNEKLLTVNFTRSAIDPGSEVALPGRVFADMAVDGDTLYVPISDEDLIAFDLNTLTQKWVFETERGIWSTAIGG